jgi:hypothetical protein
MGGDIGDEYANGTCVPTEWVTGVIVTGRSGEASIRDDRGYVRGLTWGAHTLPFVIDWNRRYTLAGHEFTGPHTLLACGGADSFIPQ